MCVCMWERERVKREKRGELQVPSVQSEWKKIFGSTRSGYCLRDKGLSGSPKKSSHLHFRYCQKVLCLFVLGKQQPSSGVIERRYGYIPNPRWPKPFSYTRSYEPVGVGDEDREGIPGVVFRTKQNRKLEGNERKNYEHSYHESDFPMLNISAMDR